ncbi:hypothetical protein EBB59_04705 [Lysobacter pythonis]|uniref:Uncharacterized protein n=1 Tax=Solilutibacter pythonis TaxID=2483112 RepID=A0A3M2I4Z2_9GAMM|nr:hypothetical protein [Lysobacter pythonis]RMH93547.1 hypothetical protein EBB59_04705 [Lysobacter pythonis]
MPIHLAAIPVNWAWACVTITPVAASGAHCWPMAGCQLQRIELQLHAGDAAAIALYSMHVFVEVGCHRRYAWRDGACVDAVTMTRFNPPSE